MGMLGKIPGMKNLAMAKQLRKQMAQGRRRMPGMPGMGGFPGMPGMGGFPGMPGMGFPGMGFPGMGMPGGMPAGARRQHDQDEAALDGGEERQEGRSASARKTRGRRAVADGWSAGAKPAVRIDRGLGCLVKGPPCVVPATGVFGDRRRRRHELVGCVGGSKGLSAPRTRSKLKPYILDAPPADIPHKLDVNFENKVHLIGYKFDPETAQARAGGEDHVLLALRRHRSTTAGSLFTHTKDEGSGKMGNLDCDRPAPRAAQRNHQVLGPDAGRRARSTSTSRPTRCPTT